MSEFTRFEYTRRRFLKTATLVAAGGFTQDLLAPKSPAVPRLFEKATAAEPTALFLTWQRDPTTTMTVQWVGGQQEAVNRPVSYAKVGSHAWQERTGNSRPFPMTDQWILRTELTGLEPGTDYRFRVGHHGSEHRFRTMPSKANDTIHFVSGGDSGIGQHAQQTNRVAAAQSPMFVVLGGDIAYENAKSPAIFMQFLKNYSRDLRDDQQRLIPLLGCLGNHEVLHGYNGKRQDAPFFYSIFDGLFPETGYARLDFGDYLSLVFLDSNHTTPIEGAQTAWLEGTLKEREECPTVFAFNHVPSYPSFRPFKYASGEEGTGAGSRKYWVPLFERYNVDAVFEHHDHTFKRTHPLLDGRVNDNGIVYLGDGSWGQLRRPETPQQRPYLAVTDHAYHLSVHRIEGRERFHVAVSDTGRVVDVCVTTKRSHRRTT